MNTLTLSAMLRGWVAKPRLARTLQATESSKSFSISPSIKLEIWPLCSPFYPKILKEKTKYCKCKNPTIESQAYTIVLLKGVILPFPLLARNVWLLVGRLWKQILKPKPPVPLKEDFNGYNNKTKTFPFTGNPKTAET